MKVKIFLLFMIGSLVSQVCNAGRSWDELREELETHLRNSEFDQAQQLYEKPDLSWMADKVSYTVAQADLNASANFLKESSIYKASVREQLLHQPDAWDKCCSDYPFKNYFNQINPNNFIFSEDFYLYLQSIYQENIKLSQELESAQKTSQSQKIELQIKQNNEDRIREESKKKEEELLLKEQQVALEKLEVDKPVLKPIVQSKPRPLVQKSAPKPAVKKPHKYDMKTIKKGIDENQFLFQVKEWKPMDETKNLIGSSYINGSGIWLGTSRVQVFSVVKTTESVMVGTTQCMKIAAIAIEPQDDKQRKLITDTVSNAAIKLEDQKVRLNNIEFSVTFTPIVDSYLLNCMADAID